MFGNGLTFGRLLRRDLDRLFGDYFEDMEKWWPERGGTPAVNLWEDEMSIYAEAEMPGLRMEDLDLHVIGNELVMKGERKPEERAGVAYHRQERGTGQFTRIIRLPTDVDEQGAGDQGGSPHGHPPQGGGRPAAEDRGEARGVAP